MLCEHFSMEIFFWEKNSLHQLLSLNKQNASSLSIQWPISVSSLKSHPVSVDNKGVGLIPVMSGRIKEVSA